MEFKQTNKKTSTLKGNVDSFYPKSTQKYEFLMKEKQYINIAFQKQTKVEESKYKH